MAAMLTRWWWIRHAPVPDGGFIYGQRDLDCDCGDAEVFATLARELPADAVWLTSNLVRTRQTAAAILAAAAEGRHGAIEPLAVPDLAEQHLGEWQGLDRRAFYAARRIGTHTLWFAAADERPPGGESFADLTARVFPAIERLNEEHVRPRYRRRHARRHDPGRAGPGARRSAADRTRLHRGELLADPPRSPGA